MKGTIFAAASALALTVASGAMAAQSTTPTNASPSTTAEQSTTAQSQGEPRGEVKEAQQKLKSDNLYKGNVDGILGSETKQALKEFQKKNSLQQTGQLDDQTEQKLGISEQSGSSMPSTTKKQ